MAGRPLPSEDPAQPELSMHERAAQLRNEAVFVYIVNWLDKTTQDGRKQTDKEDVYRYDSKEGLFRVGKFSFDENESTRVKRLEIAYRKEPFGNDIDEWVHFEIYLRDGEKIIVLTIGHRKEIYS